jgi:hypothetical protein
MIEIRSQLFTERLNAARRVTTPRDSIWF